MLALRLCTSAICPRLPSCLSALLRSGHLKKKNNLGNRVHTEQRQNMKHNKEPPSSPQKKKVELQPRSKAGPLSFSTRVELLVFFASGFVALLQEDGVYGNSRAFVGSRAQAFRR